MPPKFDQSWHSLCKCLQVTSVQSDDYQDIPNSQIRRITAKRLLESKQTVPHYYLTIDCRVDKLVQLRQQLNADLAKDGKKLSVNDFVIKASAAVSAAAFDEESMDGGFGVCLLRRRSFSVSLPKQQGGSIDSWVE